MLNSPSTPPSSTSTRAAVTVDGLQGDPKPLDPPAALRPVEAIRADLAHPHTAALMAVRTSSVGDGPIGRLLRDVGPLLVEVERSRIAERECADFWDAMDKARSVLDEALANARQRDQARARAQIAAVAFPQSEGAPS